MKPKKFFLRFRVLIGPAVLILALGGIFAGRSPALILSDAGFDALYGPRRVLFRQAFLSLRLFRRVKRVPLAENSSPEAAVFAIEEGAAKPWAVLGHARYRQGLERYAREHPEIRTALIREDPSPEPGGPDPGSPDPGGDGPALGPESIFVDTRLGSWRAGRCAALLAGEGPGRVLVFQDRQDFPVNRDAFRAGLEEENQALIPHFLSSSADYSPWEEVRCVVLGGPADSYFNRNSGIPALLFTWLDPALSPHTVKIIGDDSPWALAPEVFRSPGKGGFRRVPMEFTLLSGRVKGGELKNRLKKAIRLQIPVSLSW
jgi:hypothetical protein